LLSRQDIALAIQTICREAKIQTKLVNFSIPDFCSFFTNFRLPIMSKEELPQAVKYEARSYIPLPFSEITLDWTVIEGEVGKTPLEILLVAIPNDIINQYRDIAALANLELRVLEPEVFALVKALAYNEKRVIGIVDIGARSTTCSIIENGVLKISHSFNLSGNELTWMIANSLNIEYNKAEELKKRYGLTFIGEELAVKEKNIREILLPSIDLILTEVKKTFHNFYQEEGKEVKLVILAGGSAKLLGLKEYFIEQLKKEVKIANPFLGISFPPLLKEILAEIAPDYAVAVGLALKGLD
jgi:type IV pilus assembly protein PilM